MEYPIFQDFEESTQEPTVRLNIQPATEPTRFSDFQLNEAITSNKSIEATSDFPTVFTHEPTPSTSVYTLLMIIRCQKFLQFLSAEMKTQQ